MGVDNVRGWYEAFERASQERERGRAELAWLGLVACDDETAQERGVYLDLGADVEDWRPEASAGGVGSSLSRVVNPAPRLAFLLGVVMIASLTTVLLCG